jgi:hypothetical protein
VTQRKGVGRMNGTYFLPTAAVQPGLVNVPARSRDRQLCRFPRSSHRPKDVIMRAFTLLALAAITALPMAAHAQTAAPAVAPSVAVPAASPTPGGPLQDPAARARFEKFRAACGTDLQTHCATVARGTEQGRTEMRQCIDANKVKFSAGCQTALKERDAERAARKEAAPADTKPKG